MFRVCVVGISISNVNISPYHTLMYICNTGVCVCACVFVTVNYLYTILQFINYKIGLEQELGCFLIVCMMYCICEYY